jgi:hypothetical protein
MKSQLTKSQQESLNRSQSRQVYDSATRTFSPPDPRRARLQKASDDFVRDVQAGRVDSARVQRFHDEIDSA